MTTGRINQVSDLAMHVHKCTTSHNLCCKPPLRQMPLHTVPMSIHITFPSSPFQLSNQCFKVFRLKSTLCLTHYLSTQPHPMRVCTVITSKSIKPPAGSNPVGARMACSTPGALAPHIVITRPVGGFPAV